ncbi:MAG: hypothetical protein AAF614_26810 [Chloroflexota bacterium]
MQKTAAPASVLPAQDFDCGTTTAAPDIRVDMQTVLVEARCHGLDIEALCHQAKTATEEMAPTLMEAIHDAAAVIFLQWRRARQANKQTQALALARLFNGLTYDARALNTRFGLISTEHIDALATSLQQEIDYDDFDPREIARHMDVCAQAHTHELAWLWVVLPTFARQPYGRILLTKADIPNSPNPIFVTQPFFLEGQCTLFHTHGQNWAYSRPLGFGDGQNWHINSLWMPREPCTPYPLDLLDLTPYSAADVAVLPPKLIHGISKKRCTNERIPTLSELLSDEAAKAEWIARTRFGERACLHIYCPHLPLINSLTDCPLVQTNEKFFIEYDMIVFDHYEETIWSGGGGSWPRRMIKFGTTGDHCGICFEDDPRKDNLDPQTVFDWLIQTPPPSLLTYRFS